ncbi:hypothetical protein E3A20_24220, partial [Planctomyces bekefii]
MTEISKPSENLEGPSNDPATTEPTGGFTFPLLFFALLILLVYSYGDIMTAPFVFDDGPNIVTNP